MRFKTRADLPATATCNSKACVGKEKPISEMVVVRHRKTGEFSLRRRCKECHNDSERGHRREYKTKYLQRWRRHNAELNRSYWKQSQQENREKINANARRRVRKHHHAILIQGRLRRRLGMSVTLAEARQMLRTFGPCYPTRFGLTPSGLRECERIRAALRRSGSKMISAIEIRMMVYADQENFFIKPSAQKIPYQAAAESLRRWQAEQREKRKAA
ncbi:MAG: hypothetical protein JWO13_805 [Acidobacteriales bacterium]|nr:hypothetical protein [Terriglobales bacterium]